MHWREIDAKPLIATMLTQYWVLSHMQYKHLIYYRLNGLTEAGSHIQYIPRNMHTVFALLCFVVVIHWLIFPYPSGLLHWHCGNLTIAPVPAKQPWWIWINTSCEFIMNDCITTTKQSTTRPCAYFLGYTVYTSVKWVAIGSDNDFSPARHQAIIWTNAGILTGPVGTYFSET